MQIQKIRKLEAWEESLKSLKRIAEKLNYPLQNKEEILTNGQR